MLHIVDDIRGDIAQALKATLKRDVAVTDDTDIARDLELDSLAVMDFVMALEDQYDISIPLDRIAEVRTIGDLVEVISALRAGTPA